MSATTFCNGTTTSGNGTTTFCNDCGNRVDLCECRLYQPRDVDKNPVVAALLSLLIPGLVFFIGWITILAWPLAVMEAYYSARVANLERRLAVL
jgi:hypothetical protein